MPVSPVSQDIRQRCPDIHGNIQAAQDFQTPGILMAILKHLIDNKQRDGRKRRSPVNILKTS